MAGDGRLIERGHLLLLHSIFGRRPAINRTAARLRDLGHQVLAPDLFDGVTTSDLGAGVDRRDRWPWAVLLEHLRAVVAKHGWTRTLPVVMGYSWGASTAVRLVASGLVARGLVLLLGGDEIPSGLDPTGLPVLLHAGSRDSLMPLEETQKVARSLRCAGAEVDLLVHDVDSHLFTDEDHPDYRACAALAAWSEAVSWLTVPTGSR